MKPTREQIQTATHEHLRVWVAEELGYVWWKRGEGSYIGLLEEDTATPDYWVKVPGAELPLDELDGGLPNWPGDIGQAWELEPDLPNFALKRRGQVWECTGRLCWSGLGGWDHVQERDGESVCSCAIAVDENPAAAICKAWLLTRIREQE